ncbi:MAG: carbohydrate-binding protein, partial [Ruminococcus sp.]|nr:carbohydrate-binding protein [Ruminococcus sp.]
MKRQFSRCVCALTAAVMIVMCGCGDQPSSTSSADSGAESSGVDSTGGETTSFSVVTSREREEIPVEEVTETRGDFDLSDVQNKSDVPEDFEVSEEAENCTLSGGAKTVDKEIFGKFTGDGYIAIGSSGDAIEFDAEFPTDGSYDFTVRAASSNSNSENFITVDGEETSTFTVNEKEFSDCVAEKVNVTKGKHKIGVKAKNGSFFVDSIKAAAAKPVDLSQFEVSKTLSNANASDETKRLYSFLCDVYGKYMISGQYASDNRGTESPEFDEFMLKTGKYPALMGLDLIEASPSRQYHGSSPGLI